MARAHAEIGGVRYLTRIKAGHHELTADEGPALGGRDAGPAPYELLLAGLGACTAITLKMYAERKDWPLEELAVGLLFQVVDGKQRIDRTLTVTGDLDGEQKSRLADIAERTPVTLTLKGAIEIKTELR